MSRSSLQREARTQNGLWPFLVCRLVEALVSGGQVHLGVPPHGTSNSNRTQDPGPEKPPVDEGHSPLPGARVRNATSSLSATFPQPA